MFKGLDAVQLAFFKNQLELILTKVYETKYPALSARSMFPVSPEGGVGIDSVTYDIWGKTGRAEFVSSYAGKIPRADVSRTSVTSPVRRMAGAFGMTIDEIAKSQVTGTPLSARKAQAVQYGHEVTLNNTAFYGNKSLNLQGLFSHPDIPNGAAPNLDIDDTLTVDEILENFAAGLEAIRLATSGLEKPNAIRLPESTYQYLALRRMSDHDSTTVLAWLKAQLAALGVTTITSYPEGEAVTMLAGTTVSSRKVVCYYSDSPMNWELFIPQDLEFLEPEKQGLEEVTVGTMTTGGLVVYTPLANYLQWISTPA